MPTKNTYTQTPRRDGRDSMRLMEMPWRANGASNSCSAPGRLGAEISSEVLSRPLGIAAHRDAVDARKIFVQPLAALRQRLMVRVHPAHRRQRICLAQDVVMNAELHFADDLERRIEKQVEGMRHHYLGGIFHRHHAVMAAAGFDVAKNIVNGVMRDGKNRMAEEY